MKFSIAKVQKNILKTYQKKLKRKTEKQQHRIKLNGREKSKYKPLLRWKSFLTWQIVILKTKIKPFTINAAANCHEYDLMMQCLHCLPNAHDRITLLICC